MKAVKARIALPGSELRLTADQHEVGVPDPAEQIEVTLLLRPRPRRALKQKVDDLASKLPSQRLYLTARQLQREFGASSVDIRRVLRFAEIHGMRAVGVSPAMRTVRLAGQISKVDSAFGTRLAQFRDP